MEITIKIKDLENELVDIDVAVNSKDDFTEEDAHQKICSACLQLLDYFLSEDKTA